MTSLDERWADLAANGQRGGAIKLSEPGSDVYAYLDDEGQSGILFIVPSEAPAVPAFQTLYVASSQRPDGRWALRVVLTNKELKPLFCLLCSDLIDASEGVDAASLGAFVVGRLARWKRLLEGGLRDRLSLVRLRGLFAELFILRASLKYVDADTAVKGWVGPLAAPQDFVFADGLVEVKAVTEDAQTIHISSIEQLDVPVDVRLALAVVCIRSLAEASETGQSLEQLANELRAALGFGSAAEQAFLLKLRAAGCADPTIYGGNRFLATSVDWCAVGGEFPCVRRAFLPSGVGDAEYDLNIAVVRAFSTKEEELVELAQFREKLEQEVAIRAEANQDFAHAAFVEYTLDLMSDAGAAADVQMSHLRECRLERRLIEIDAYAVDELDQSLKVFYADRCGDATMTKTKASTLFDRMRGFIQGSITGKIRTVIAETSDAFELAEYIRVEWKTISRVRAYLITDGVLSSQVLKWDEGEIEGVPFECHIWDLSRMLKIENSRNGLGDLVVKFGHDGVACLEATLPEDKYGAYLCVLPGDLLADMYEEYGSRLLEGNVRAFLSARGKVNKGIRNTIQHQPEMVFAYNNGIAATASKVKIASGPNGPRVLEAAELQIVNGGQTTASLANARRNDRFDLSNVFVPMKLSVIDSEHASDMIQNISRFANTQNRVSDSDFFANHEFHRRMEVISRRLLAPAVHGHMYETHWFYERARAQYDTAKFRLSEAQRKRFQLENPPGQKITKTDLAKFENTWGELPYTVSKGAQANFTQFAEHITKRWDADNAEFGEKYFRTMVAKAILFRATTQIVKAREFGGFGANIVTYTLARIAHEIRERRLAANFSAIWNAQDVSEAWTRLITQTCSAVFEALISPPAGEVNVTQWCKKQQCWLSIQNVPCELPSDFIGELESASNASARKVQAKKAQRLDSGIESQARVLEVGPQTWVAMRQWAKERGLLDESMDSLLKLASLDGAFPDAKQSAKLLDLKDRLEVEGFYPGGLAV